MVCIYYARRVRSAISLLTTHDICPRRKWVNFNLRRRRMGFGVKNMTDVGEAGARCRSRGNKSELNGPDHDLNVLPHLEYIPQGMSLTFCARRRWAEYRAITRITISIMATRRTLLLCIHDIRATSSVPHRPFTRQSRARPWLSTHKHVRSFASSRSRWQEGLSQQESNGEPVIDRTRSKVFHDADEAVADLKSGSTVLSAGFGLCGTAETIIAALHRRGADSLNNLTAVSNNAGASGAGGLSPLTRSGQITRCILSYLGNNKTLEQKYLTGNIAIELCPQGTLAERIRAGGAGIPAFYTPTGVREWCHSATQFPS